MDLVAGGAAGTLVIGRLMDKVNPYTLIAGFFLLDAVAIGTIGFLTPASVAFVMGLVVWNFCQTGGQTGINTLATLGYPPEMRSSGIGWAGASGRVGGIVFPFAGGTALGTTLSLETIMLLIAVPAVLVALLILWLGAVNRRAPAAGFEPLPA